MLHYVMSFIMLYHDVIFIYVILPHDYHFCYITFHIMLVMLHHNIISINLLYIFHYVIL